MSYWVFCSTSLPLTSTRWFDQHFQAFHTRLISVIWRMINPSEIIILRKNSWERQELNPGLLGEKRERYTRFCEIVVVKWAEWAKFNRKVVVLANFVHYQRNLALLSPKLSTAFAEIRHHSCLKYQRKRPYFAENLSYFRRKHLL